jgi:hypothetical protein
MKPGRKSSAANVVSLVSTNLRTVLTPIGSPLTKEEHTIFNHIVKEHNHLTQVDVPILQLFAASIVRAMKARREGNETFERESRAALALARSLRLTQQSARDPKTVARSRHGGSRSYYESQRGQEQDD